MKRKMSVRYIILKIIIKAERISKNNVAFNKSSASSYSRLSQILITFQSLYDNARPSLRETVGNVSKIVNIFNVI